MVPASVKLAAPTMLTAPVVKIIFPFCALIVEALATEIVPVNVMFVAELFVKAPAVPPTPVPLITIGSAFMVAEFRSSVPPLLIVVFPAVVPNAAIALTFTVIPDATKKVPVKVFVPPRIRVPFPAVCAVAQLCVPVPERTELIVAVTPEARVITFPVALSAMVLPVIVYPSTSKNIPAFAFGVVAVTIPAVPSKCAMSPAAKVVL